MNNRINKYCDSCLTIAYDIVGEDGIDQDAYLDTFSGLALMEDHLCDRIETNNEIECDCQDHMVNAYIKPSKFMEKQLDKHNTNPNNKQIKFAFNACVESLISNYTIEQLTIAVEQYLVNNPNHDSIAEMVSDLDIAMPSPSDTNAFDQATDYIQAIVNNSKKVV